MSADEPADRHGRDVLVGGLRRLALQGWPLRHLVARPDEYPTIIRAWLETGFVHLRHSASDGTGGTLALADALTIADAPQRWADPELDSIRLVASARGDESTEEQWLAGLRRVEDGGSHGWDVAVVEVGTGGDIPIVGNVFGDDSYRLLGLDVSYVAALHHVPQGTPIEVRYREAKVTPEEALALADAWFEDHDAEVRAWPIAESGSATFGPTRRRDSAPETYGFVRLVHEAEAAGYIPPVVMVQIDRVDGHVLTDADLEDRAERIQDCNERPYHARFT